LQRTYTLYALLTMHTKLLYEKPESQEDKEWVGNGQKVDEEWKLKNRIKAT